MRRLATLGFRDSLWHQARHPAGSLEVLQRLETQCQQYERDEVDRNLPQQVEDVQRWSGKPQRPPSSTCSTQAPMDHNQQQSRMHGKCHPQHYKADFRSSGYQNNDKYRYPKCQHCGHNSRKEEDQTLA